MEFNCQIIGLTKDVLTDAYNVTLAASDLPVKALDDLQGIELSATLKRKVKRRSKDANALLWACIGEIAGATTPPLDKWQVYLTLLKRYGKYTYICVKPQVVDAVKSQWRETEVLGEIEINGQKAVQMLCYFGSHTYTTAEFSKLLDGTISEMQELGLAPPTSEQMRASLEEWEKKLNQ